MGLVRDESTLWVIGHFVSDGFRHVATDAPHRVHHNLPERHQGLHRHRLLHNGAIMAAALILTRPSVLVIWIIIDWPTDRADSHVDRVCLFVGVPDRQRQPVDAATRASEAVQERRVAISG